MSLYKPSRLFALLQEHDTGAKKRFSQNFLIDRNILRKIATAAKIEKGDIVIEIGSGPGALTEILLEHGALVTAIEIDKTLIDILKHALGENASLEILQADVLKLPLALLCEKKARDKKIKIVANLPYHITTPILTRLVPLSRWIDSVTVMVQKEFAERICASAGSADYGSFTLFMQYYSERSYCFTINPSCFYPAPQVHSALIHCALHTPPLEEALAENFFKLTRSAFQQRRKMLRSSLKKLYPRIAEALQALALNPNTRPEELSLDAFLSLFAHLIQCDIGGR